MIKVNAAIAQEPYKVEIKSPSGNVLLADEPTDNGGNDLGFSPKELLASALAACTNITVKMYANRKAWDLQEVKTEVQLERNESENKTIINRKIECVGTLSEEQKTRLLQIANACPVHKILSNSIEINTTGI